MMSEDVMERVPDGWVCNMETPSTKPCSCRRDKHVVAFSRTKMCAARDASVRDADVVKVGRTVPAVINSALINQSRMRVNLIRTHHRRFLF